MILSFLESLKHTGGLKSIALLRIYVGFYYLEKFLKKINSDFLTQPLFASELNEAIAKITISPSYKTFLESIVIHNWLVSSYIVVIAEGAIAISYILGYLTRPIAIIACLIVIFFISVSSVASAESLRLLLAIHVTLLLIGGGRCLGIDYYFYKKDRGLLW
jgi:thiosulfate dehydrogenase [quinone] large subunit